VPPSSPHAPLAGLHPIVTWLLDESRPLNLDALVVGLCERLLEAGVPLSRAFIPNVTAHPEVFGRASIWRRGEPLAIEVVSHTELAGMPVGPASSESRWAATPCGVCARSARCSACAPCCPDKVVGGFDVRVAGKHSDENP
jgi:hypothetical protein